MSPPKAYQHGDTSEVTFPSVLESHGSRPRPAQPEIPLLPQAHNQAPAGVLDVFPESGHGHGPRPWGPTWLSHPQKRRSRRLTPATKVLVPTGHRLSQVGRKTVPPSGLTSVKGSLGHCLSPRVLETWVRHPGTCGLAFIVLRLPVNRSQDHMPCWLCHPYPCPPVGACFRDSLQDSFIFFSPRGLSAGSTVYPRVNHSPAGHDSATPIGVRILKCPHPPEAPQLLCKPITENRPQGYMCCPPPPPSKWRPNIVGKSELWSSAASGARDVLGTWGRSLNSLPPPHSLLCGC